MNRGSPIFSSRLSLPSETVRECRPTAANGRLSVTIYLRDNQTGQRVFKIAEQRRILEDI